MSTWSYLYISEEEPTSIAEGHSWYNSNGDKCYGAVWTKELDSLYYGTDSMGVTKGVAIVSTAPIFNYKKQSWYKTKENDMDTFTVIGVVSTVILCLLIIVKVIDFLIMINDACKKILNDERSETLEHSEKEQSK